MDHELTRAPAEVEGRPLSNSLFKKLSHRIFDISAGKRISCVRNFVSRSALKCRLACPLNFFSEPQINVMANQQTISEKIERLSFWLRVAKAKFNLALEQGREFAELKSILIEIKSLERDLKENMSRVPKSA